MDTVVAVRDHARLEALMRTNLLDSPAEEQFDRLTRLAATFLKAPVALVTLVDADRLFFKSQLGLAEPWASARQAGLAYSFCPNVVATEAPVIITDARTNIRDLSNPALSQFGAFAYAGIPLKTSQGHVLGSFSVIEHRPRIWTLQDVGMLTDLAALVMTEIELRAGVRETEEKAADAEHERQLKTTLLESTSEGICGLDLDGLCTFINGSGAKMLGFSPTDLIGKRLQILLHMNEKNGMPDLSGDWPIFHALERGEECRFDDALFCRKDRTTFRVEYSFSPIVQDGAVQGAVIAFVDVTDRKKAEVAVREAEEKFRSIFENALEGIYQSNPRGRLVSINPALARIFGYASPDEMMLGVQHVGRDLYVDAARRAQFIRQISTADTVSEFESQVYRKDKSIIWVSETARVVRDAEGCLQYYEGTVENITERWEAQEVQRRQNEYLEALHETTLALMNRLDLGDLLEAIVLRAAQLLGTSHGYICLLDAGSNENLVIKVGVGLYSGHIGYHIKMGEGAAGIVWETERTCVLNDYATSAYRSAEFQEDNVKRVFAAPLSSGKKFLGVIGMAYDGETQREFGRAEVTVVNRFAQLASLTLDNARLYMAAQQELTERRRVEAALHEAKEAAEIANGAKSLFLANMSHELRTPLNAIIGYSEMLQEEAEDQELDAFIPDLKKIHTSGRHLLALINDILDLSKIEAGKMDLLLEIVEVSTLIQEVASTIVPMMAKNSNKFIVDCPADIGAACTDPVKVRQSLLNLLSNASKFTDQGTITLAARRTQDTDRPWEGDWIEYSVADTGIGITPAQMQKLFEPFSQAEAGTSRKYGGTGLGLALTRRFCKLMGGDVLVSSEWKKGSTFTLRLPAVGAPGEIKET